MLEQSGGCQAVSFLLKTMLFCLHHQVAHREQGDMSALQEAIAA
jgi:hypothetical protein